MVLDSSKEIDSVNIKILASFRMKAACPANRRYFAAINYFQFG